MDENDEYPEDFEYWVYVRAEDDFWDEEFFHDGGLAVEYYKSLKDTLTGNEVAVLSHTSHGVLMSTDSETA